MLSNSKVAGTDMTMGALVVQAMREAPSTEHVSAQQEAKAERTMCLGLLTSVGPFGILWMCGGFMPLVIQHHQLQALWASLLVFAG